MLNLLESFNSNVISNAYELFGSFFNGDYTTFRVWAPNAQKVSVVGDFNGWDVSKDVMQKIRYGCWELKIKGIKNFSVYKYAVTGCNGTTVLKSDPYARHFETAPSNASKVYGDDGFCWSDSDWIKLKATKNIYESPVNIYEVHLGSWRRYSDGNLSRRTRRIP